MLAYINAIHSMHWGINPPSPLKNTPSSLASPPPPVKSENCPSPPFQANSPPPCILVFSDHNIEIFHP